MKLLKPAEWLQEAQDSLERRVHTNHEEVVLQQARYWTRAIVWTLIACTGFGIAWLALAKTEEIVTAQGKLEPIGSVKDVQVPLEGVIKQILVKDGAHVKQGQVLIQLDTEASNNRKASALDAIRLKRQELALKQLELERSEELSATQIRVLRESLFTVNDILRRYEALSAQGATSQIQTLEQRNKAQEIRGQIQTTAVDNRRKTTVLKQNIQELVSQISELNNKLVESNVTLRYQAIKSPVAGVVFELKPKGAGYVSQGSETVLKIVPYDKLKAKVEIDSAHIGFVSVGKSADISIDSFPATDFGVLSGTVTKIGSDALPPDPAQNKQTYRYPADITLSSQQLKLKDGSKLPLQVGMSLTANIKLRKVTYLQLLLSDFKSKADSLRRI
ncbi:MAG: HlyD family efflux transporter periplasmic adaptor subunit [Prochlorococcaceae cyanobacterium]